MIEHLQWLSQQEDPAVSNRAQQALHLTDLLNRGEISPDEYQELCRDLSRMDQLDRECSSIEMKTLLVTAIWAVAQLR
jgi:hypothetical protein